MTIAKCHISNFGSFGGGLPADFCGYVTYHKSARYSNASEDQLGEWSSSRYQAVRNAVEIERAERALARWQDKNC